MPVYVYRAITKTGQEVKNRVEDTNRLNLIKKLKRNGLLPISVTQLNYRNNNVQKAKRKNMENIEKVLRKVNTADIDSRRGKRRITLKDRALLLFSKGERVTQRDVMVFTENFYLLKKANFNNIHALSTIIESTDNLSLRGILQDILAGVESGEYMYTTMEYYSNIFPYIYINMIRVGEMSGSLEKSLEQAVKYLEDVDSTTSRLKKIIIPNVLQLLAILGLLIFGVAYIIPLIQEAFEQSGTTQTLPEITLWFVNFCNGLINVWYIPVIIISSIVGGVMVYIRTPKGRYDFDYFKYKMPIFGKLIYAMDFSRFMRAMLLNLENGMRIQEALDVSKAVIKNYVMLSIIETAINNILIGASWIEPFENTGLSSSMQTEMLKIGMQTDLIEMMKKLVEYMEMDINNLIQKVMTVLPQVVYSIVGVFLIFLVIVVIVPCIQLYMGGWIFDSVDLDVDITM